MNQQRLQAYVDLIQQLLACPKGEEWILLRQNESLVSPELVQVMEQVATQLATQGNAKESKFLHNLAGQIHHLFAAPSVRQRDGEDAPTEAYIDLIKALLACPEGAEEELLTANQHLIGPGLVQTMQQVANQMAANGDRETAQYLHQWAEKLAQLWLQQHNFPAIAQSVPPAQVAMQPVAVPAGVSMHEPDLDQEGWQAPEIAPMPNFPAPVPSSLSEPRSPLSQPLDGAMYRQLNDQLSAIAVALTKLSETLASPPSAPPDPLAYLDTLERACEKHWVLSREDIQHLIGTAPTGTEPHGAFEHRGWVFVKAGDSEAQPGWRVKKEHKK